MLQVDSHTHFKKKWDIILIRDWEATNDPRAILTTYPLALEHEKDVHEYTRVPRICGYYWNGAMPFNQQVSCLYCCILLSNPSLH